MLVASNNFLVPNLTFVFELLAFLGVLYFLARVVLPPLGKALSDRESVIRKGLEDAEEAKRRVAQTETDYQETLARGRTEAQAIVAEATRIGERLRTEARLRGEQEAQRLLVNARAEIDASARRAAEDLRREVSGLVITVVEKVVGEALDAAAHRELIDRTIREVEAEADASPEVRA